MASSSGDDDDVRELDSTEDLPTDDDEDVDGLTTGRKWLNMCGIVGRAPLDARSPLGWTRPLSSLYVPPESTDDDTSMALADRINRW